MRSIHVCVGTGRKFLVRLHLRGARKYEVRSRHRSCDAAIRRLGRTFADANYDYNRADVIMVADFYEPVQIVEMVRKA